MIFTDKKKKNEKKKRIMFINKFNFLFRLENKKK